jgi:hypothetical protein
MDPQSLGRYLRETREARELTLDDAEQALKIRRRILEAFELGQFTFSAMTPVQVRGFIRNYARYLGLEEDRVVGYYEAARHAVQYPPRRSRNNKRRTQPAAPVAARRITDTNPALPAVPAMLERSTRRETLFNLIVRSLVALASIAVIAFVVYQLIGQTSQPAETDPAGDSILAQLPPTHTSPPFPTSTPPVPIFATAATPVQDFSGVLVSITMAQRAWLRISSDGVQRYAGLARPGEQLPDIAAQDNVTVTSSNAEALRVIYNGKAQPIFGGRGQRVDIVFTPTDVQVSSGPGFEPTPEASPTPPPTSNINVAATIAALTPSATPGPSPTPTNTPTYTPTITLTPSITPTPSDTPTATLTPTITPTPSPTAILPPRVTQEGLPPTKPAG